MTVVAVSGLKVSLGGAEILHGIDLDAGAGEWVGVIGPNGSGKTTLLRALVGEGIVSGSVRLMGGEVKSLDRRARARLAAAVPQRPTIPGAMPVIDYVLLGRAPHLHYLAGEGPDDLAAARGAIRDLRLTELAGRKLATLSGGELQRVILARALAQEAPILLLDEPTSALDVGHQQQVLGLLDGLRRREGLTVISAIHDLTLAAQFCDRLVLMAGGTVASSGDAGSVLTEAAIHRHYGANVRVIDDGRGSVVVIPLRDSRPAEKPATMTGPS